MLKLFSAPVLLAVTVSALSAQAYAPPCDRPGLSMVDVGTCLDQEFARADSAINAVYRQVLNPLDSTQRLQLRQVQREWLGRREAIRNAKVEGEGNHPSLVLLPDVIQMTKDRVAFLRAMAGLPEESSFPLPVTTTFRASKVNRGLVAQFTNNGNQVIVVQASFMGRSNPKGREFTLTLTPGKMKEFGYLEGWQFERGDRIDLIAAGFPQTSLVVGGQSADEMRESMKSNLRSLVVHQESYFAAYDDYAGGTTEGEETQGAGGAGRLKFKAGVGNQILIDQRGRDGWAAIAVNPALTSSPQVCGVFVGKAQFSPNAAVTHEGVPDCWSR